MSKVLFLESVAGVAGDMFTASFVDAELVSKSELESLPQKLGLEGVELEFKTVRRATMRATHLNVKWRSEEWKRVFGNTHHQTHSHHHEYSHQHAHENSPHTHSHQHTHAHHSHEPHHDAPAPETSHHHAHAQHSHTHEHSHDESGHSHENTNLLIGEEARAHWHTHYGDIDRLIARSALEEATKNLARRIFRLIAEAEAAAHGMEVEQVAFHEVGTIDSILDVVMAAYCINRVGAEKIYATPIKTGRGFIKMSHGAHAIPPPASARLLTGLPTAKTPDAIARENVELSTPTGIAILKALAPEFTNELPAGTILQQGMGAGSMDLGEFPNVFRVMLLDEQQAALFDEKQAADKLPYESDEVMEVACNIDDDTSERIAWLADELRAKGALDVWLAPITGKKGRAAVCLSLLAEMDRWTNLADWLLRHSTTFGVRYKKWNRLKLARRFEPRATAQGEVTYKIGLTTANEIVKEKPEFENLRRVWADETENHHAEARTQ